LKAFTQDGKNAAVNLLNLDRERCIPGTPVKNQCSGDYFYGQDVQLEKAIQTVETEYAAAVARIQKPGDRLTDNDRFVLRIFILFQYMRTEAASRRSVEMFGGMEVAIRYRPRDGGFQTVHQRSGSDGDAHLLNRNASPR